MRGRLRVIWLNSSLLYNGSILWAGRTLSHPNRPEACRSPREMFPHVPLGALQPGDLVFKGPGGSEHVAIYVGNGMQIAATHTGSYVLLQPVDYPGLTGAVRP